MGKATGFMEISRADRTYRPVEERLRHFDEFTDALPEEQVVRQAARCMDCGIPYCHQGCPVNNQIPDWNDLVYRKQWREAVFDLHTTNNFPEFTGRVCPAPCEAACTLNIDDSPVTIKTIECAIIDRAWREGWVKPELAGAKTGRTIAVVGSGPAGLAAAQQLARAGHRVTVYEKNARPGGLLRYGIPDFKLAKQLIDRRIRQMESEGVTFRCGVHVGVDVDPLALEQDYDALLLAGGSEVPRDLPLPGRELEGVHFAMDFLTQQNRRIGGEPLDGTAPITAQGKAVVVIGGGDTGSDCIGTSLRQGAASVTQLEILPMPPEREDKDLIWPDWPVKLRTSTSHEEGARREFAVMTQGFAGEEGRVRTLQAVRVSSNGNGFDPVAGSEFTLPAELVLLAMGFIHPSHDDGLLHKLELALDGRGNVRADTQNYRTNRPKVFAAGDMRRGQSLVVWAIREGREAASAIDAFLAGRAD